MAKSILTRQQKLFRMESVCPFDANNVSLDEAMAKLFIYLRTGGRKIATTSKPFYLAEDQAVPETLLDIVLDEKPGNFQGVTDTQRKELLSAWVGSHFAIMTKSRKLGEQRITGMRPLHFAIIKLFNPRVRSQDRYLSDFFFNALKDDPALASNPDSLFKQFFGVCVRPFGNTDFQVDEAEITKLAKSGGIDIELLFLLRLLEPFESDTFGLKKDERAAAFSFLCPEQIALLRQDLQLLFLYKGKIPRRELINYMMTLLAFHAALYFFQVSRITNYMVQNGKMPAPRGADPKPGEARSSAPFRLDFFCDLTGGHDVKVKEMAERRYTEHFKEVEAYFHSAYLMKKLEEFALSGYITKEQREMKGKDYVGLLLGLIKHKDLEGFFAKSISDIQANARDDETGEDDPTIQRIIDIGAERKQSKLHTYVDILCHFQHSQLRDQHRKLISSLCGFELDRGFLTGVGRGRARRRYVLGNELLEVLLQLAVLRKRASDQKWHSREIEIGEFVHWLQERYGLLIDKYGDDVPEDEQTNRALAVNYEHLKIRLRQLGFFTALSDASNSQVIRPRFPIVEDEPVLATAGI